ncbi:MAG: leucine-rich repeat protein [Clostridiales bacterium]|nr:leucine-rich repeat protein [Clostridiales bacterium]
MKNKLKLALVTLLSATALCGCFIGCNSSDRNDGPPAGGSTDTSIGNSENNNDNNNNVNGGSTTEVQKPIATEGIEYEKIKENDRVVGYKVIGIGTAKDTVIVIPDEYEEKPVTSIGAKAFEDCYKITKITLPDTITDIQEDAFIGCEKLQFTDYGNAKYLGTADNAYFAVIEAENTAITSVTIHAQTKVSAKYAFSGCKNLGNVSYSGSLADWCDIDFSGDFANPLTMNAYLNINSQRVYNLEIPNTVTSIKKYAFNRMIVKSIKIPTSVTDIGYAAFSSVTGLTSDVVIPTNVTYIDKFAFSFMEGEYDIKINADELVLEENAFAYCNGVGELTISGERVEIGAEAFEGCEATSLTVMGGYVDVGISAFKYADFTSVQFKNSGTDLQTGAFSSCSKLAYAEFECLFSIGGSAFSSCDKLSDIHYGGSKSDWENVDKRYSWLGYRQVLTIRCSDGTVTAK